MRPAFRSILAGVAAAGLMGSTALAQQIVVVPEGQGMQPGADQRFILVPAPPFEPDPNARARGADSTMALELYRRGYQQGMADAERAGAARPAIDPAAIERIGRELFERGYVLGMMQAQLQAAQKQGQQEAGQQQDQQTAGQQGQQTAGQQGGQAQAGAAPQDVTITTEISPEYGPYLVDAHGQALYMFTADTQGQGDAEKAVSNCYDACAEAWPPVLTSGMAVEAAGEVQADLLATIERRDGSTQITYNGWPLYYYAEDQGVGEATGQDVHGFGGEWYLLTPEGETVGER